MSSPDNRLSPETTEELLNILLAGLGGRGPDFIIGGAEDPYIRRWWLKRERESGSVYLHQIIRDDEGRALHDHPWPSVSIVLRGTLREVLPGGESRLLKPGSITSRAAEDAHRLEVVDGSVWTLFATGPVERSWGFHCPKGWVPWREFVSPSDAGVVGRGCEEE